MICYVAPDYILYDFFFSSSIIGLVTFSSSFLLTKTSGTILVMHKIKKVVIFNVRIDKF
jgi:hypothetical protein